MPLHLKSPMDLHAITPELARVVAGLVLNNKEVQKALGDEMLEELTIPQEVIPEEMKSWWDDWERNVMSDAVAKADGLDQLMIEVMSDWLEEDMRKAFKEVGGLLETFDPERAEGFNRQEIKDLESVLEWGSVNEKEREGVESRIKKLKGRIKERKG